LNSGSLATSDFTHCKLYRVLNPFRQILFFETWRFQSFEVMTSLAFDMSGWNNSVQAGWYTARTGGKSYGSLTRSRICKKQEKTLYLMCRTMRGGLDLLPGRSGSTAQSAIAIYSTIAFVMVKTPEIERCTFWNPICYGCSDRCDIRRISIAELVRIGVNCYLAE
ncbi:hypothetical protein KCU95_g119, partial [Aureobasidium melanogenum]